MQGFPKKITFLTDGNEAVLTKVEPTKSKNIVGYYKYTVSHTKLGKEYPFELDYLIRLNKNGLIKFE